MKTLINRKNLILLLLMFIALTSCNKKKEYLSYTDSNITVFCDKEIGIVNKKIFGNNFVGYDPMTYEDWAKEYYGYSDYGAGIWDSKRKKSVNEVIALAREAGITVARFPGGCGTHHYNWKNAIGKDRKHFLYGIDEFLKTCDEIKAEPIITVSYFTGNEYDAADLVEYLNAQNDGKNHNGGVDWARKRAKNGHNLPYNVKYFEIGNEVWHGDHGFIKEVSPAEYAKRYLKYYNAMKKIDPKIKIGLIFFTEVWNKNVIKIVEDKLDFIITHVYPVHVYPVPELKEIRHEEIEEIFRILLGKPIYEYENDFQDNLRLLNKISAKDIPSAITEYNIGFVQDEPVPYRHCLGTALLNAELLRIFMKPEHKILIANYWDFVNEYWGMICNGFDGNYADLYNQYYKRPNFYVFELYHKHFGDILLLTETESGYYMVEDNKIPYLSINASVDKEKEKVYLIVINKNLDNSITTTISLKDFKPSNKGFSRVLNGPSIDATNEENHDNVKIKEYKFDIKGQAFEFTFEPHSLTAIELESKGK